MKKILVVDNNKVILRLMTFMLQKMGHTVQTAEDGLSALNIMQSFRPDVVFIDLIMPNISGDRLCRIIRQKKEYDSVMLVILSAIAAEGNIDFKNFGADACIAKGPAHEMEKHISAVLSHAYSKESSSLPENIMGLEDVHEREITKELLATKKHFEITLENMADGFVEVTKKGTIIFANAAATLFFNTAEEKLLSTRFFDYFEEQSRVACEHAFARLAETPCEIGEEHPLMLNEKYILLKFVPIVVNGGKSVIILINDITKRKQAEEKLQTHLMELEDMVAQRTAEYEEINESLQEALSKVKQLSGFLPICASCKKIRDDKGYWNQLESYIRDHSEAEFSHGICPDCARMLYPDHYKNIDKEKK